MLKYNITTGTLGSNREIMKQQEANTNHVKSKRCKARM
jgi:hypothetical protein